MGGPVGLVTGASGGIGQALAQQLAASRFDLTLSGRRADVLERVANELRNSYGVGVSTVVADLADEDQVHNVVERHTELHDRLDVLVLCAGVGTAGNIDGYPLSRLDKQLAVNLRAPFQLVGELLPLLRKTASEVPARGAKIVAVASILGIVSEPALAAYAASKSALISLCEVINMEASEEGVTATTLSPGFVSTEMSQWVQHRVPASSMIPVSDIAELFAAVLKLSSRTVVPNVVISRAGKALWRA